MNYDTSAIEKAGEQNCFRLFKGISFYSKDFPLANKLRFIRKNYRAIYSSRVWTNAITRHKNISCSRFYYEIKFYASK